MKQRIKTIFHSAKSNKVVSGSAVMIAGGFLGSFTNYLYHLVMARSLGPKDYGILESIISIIYQLSIPISTLMLVITKYVASYKGRNEWPKITSFFWKILKKLMLVVPFIFLILLLLIPSVAKFLHLTGTNSTLLTWIILYFCIGIFSSVGKSVMQGLSRFVSLSISGLMDGVFRLLVAVVFILIGWGLFGAVFSFFVSAVVTLFITGYFVRDLFKGEKNYPIGEKKDMFKYIIPVFLTNLGLTSLITSDVILVRHFFSAETAGVYSALSTLGKIIFFASAPVTTVIFPLVAESHAGGKGIKKEALSGILIISLIIFGILLIFGLFPKIMVGLLFGEKYLGMISLVFLFSLGMAFYTINSLFLNIFLALKRTFPAFLIILSAIFQIILIILFHQSLNQIVNIFISTSALLLVTLLLYYFYTRRYRIVSE